MNLDKEEKEILEAYEKGEFSSIPNSRKKIAEYKKHSVQTLQKNKRINIRISEKDLLRPKRKAVEEGLPYQTLISSILHKFASGKINGSINHN